MIVGANKLSRFGSDELKSILEIINKITTLDSGDNVKEILQNVKTLMPAEKIVAGIAKLDNKGRFLRTECLINESYDLNWLKIYFENNYIEVDPVMQEFFLGYKQQVWSECFSKVNNQDSHSFIEIAKSYNLVDGITQGIFSKRHNMVSVFALSGIDLAKDNTYHSMLDILNPYLHLGIMKTHFSPKIELPSISRRELEVLNWLKEGKTNWEISCILTISERTVKYHVENILGKLQVSNRTRAVAMAVSLGIVAY